MISSPLVRERALQLRVGRVTWVQRLSTLAGLGTWALAAGVALQGQSLATSAHPEDARPWLIAAALIGFGGVRLLEQVVPDTAPADAAVATRPLTRSRRHLGGLALMGLGVLYSLLATGLLVMHAAESTAISVWLLGLTAAIVGTVLIGRPFQRVGRPSTQQLVEIGLVLIVLAVAVALRLPNLATIPPQVHGDEADVGLLARDILAGRMPTLFGTAPAAEATSLTFALHAATMRIFGDDLFGLRMGAVIEGVLSVALLYLFARRLWGSRVALLGAAFMAVAAWHIQFSRTGFHYMQAPVAMLLALYCMVRAIQDRRPLDWLLCGFALGVCIEVYYAARLAPVILAIYLGYRAITERGFVRTHAVGLAALVLGVFVFLAPMAAVYGRSEGSFIQRAAAVLVTSPNNLQHEYDAFHVSTLPEVLAIQAQHSLEAFHIRGETSLEYGHPGPLFDFWTGALLAMGAAAILLRLGSSRGMLLASWFWIALFLGSVMTTDALFSPHLVVAIPALALVPALMLETAWRGMSSLVGRVGTYAFGVVAVAVLGLALAGNVHDYFDVQVVERQPAGRFTLLSNYGRSIADSYRLYTIGRSDWTLNYDTPRFLLPHPDAVDVRNAALGLPLDHIPASKGVAFLVESGIDDFGQRTDAIRRAYPGVREEVIFERPGQASFTSFLVDNAALATANPAAQRD